MDIKKLEVGTVFTNCYILNDSRGNAVIIDPGAEPGRIEAYIGENSLSPKAILLTHGHFDHIMAVNVLRERYNIPVYAGRGEDRLMEDERLNCCVLIRAHYTSSPDRLLSDGERLEFGVMCCETIFTPGHTAGSVCYYFEEEKALFCGDTLFYESAGRTDLPTGSTPMLIDSINVRLAVLPDETAVYPGHGRTTDIEHERYNNVYFNRL